MNKNNFLGPLFIVGLSRSGTKLLRDLLNRNDLVKIPEIETHFIPELLKRPDISIEKAHDIVSNSLFKQRFPDVKFPTIGELERLKKIETIRDYIEVILKFYGVKGVGMWNKNVIWGDKTPLYLRHLDTLKKAFPNAKVIHIVRDPRDRAISVKKTWNKSMFRATEKWRREVENAQPFKDDNNFYFELRYEDLLNSTVDNLKEISGFLGIEFQEKMLTLEKPSEKHGDNKQVLTVNSNNSKKFLKYDKKVIKRIEEIAFPFLDMYNYDPVYAKMHKAYPEYLMEVKKYTDYINFKISNKIKGY